MATLSRLRRSLEEDPNRNKQLFRRISRIEREVDELLPQVSLVELASSGILHRNVEVLPLGGLSDAALAVVRTRSLPAIGYLVEVRGMVDLYETDVQTYISLKVRDDRVTPPYLLVHGDPLFAPDPPASIDWKDVRLTPFQEIAFSAGYEVERECKVRGISILVVDEVSFADQGMSVVQRDALTIVPARLLTTFVRAELPAADSADFVLHPFEGIDLGRSNIL